MHRLDQLETATRRWVRDGSITQVQADAILGSEMEDLYPFEVEFLRPLAWSVAGVCVSMLLLAFKVSDQPWAAACAAGLVGLGGLAAARLDRQVTAQSMWTASAAMWAVAYLASGHPSWAIVLPAAAWLCAGLAFDLAPSTRAIWLFLTWPASVGVAGALGIAASGPLVVTVFLGYLGASWFRISAGSTGRPMMLAAAAVCCIAMAIGNAAFASASSPTELAALVGATLFVGALLAWSPGAMREWEIRFPWDDAVTS